MTKNKTMNNQIKSMFDNAQNNLDYQRKRSNVNPSCKSTDTYCTNICRP
jgi:hypothetical protein